MVKNPKIMYMYESLVHKLDWHMAAMSVTFSIIFLLCRWLCGLWFCPEEGYMDFAFVLTMTMWTLLLSCGYLWAVSVAGVVALSYQCRRAA